MTREELLAQYSEPSKVLDHGMVRLVDVMGDDTAVVQMARTSYGAGTQTASSDENLLRYLMRHQHTSPFEGAVAKLHIKCPILVARQLVRHRTSSMNEVSYRYSEVRDEFYLPDLELNWLHEVLLGYSIIAQLCKLELLRNLQNRLQ